MCNLFVALSFARTLKIVANLFHYIVDFNAFPEICTLGTEPRHYIIARKQILFPHYYLQFVLCLYEFFVKHFQQYVTKTTSTASVLYLLIFFVKTSSHKEV